MCPQDHVVVGFELHTEGFTSHIGVLCAPIQFAEIDAGTCAIRWQREPRQVRGNTPRACPRDTVVSTLKSSASRVEWQCSPFVADVGRDEIRVRRPELAGGGALGRGATRGPPIEIVAHGTVLRGIVIPRLGLGGDVRAVLADARTH